MKPLAALCTDLIQPNEFIREYTEESPDSVALLRAASVRDCELDLSDLVFVAKSKLESKSFEASYIHEGDILITRTGAKAGETCAVPALNRAYIISSHSIRVVPRQEVVESKYLELFLVCRWGKAQVNRLFTGAAQPQLQLSTVSQLQVPIPTRRTQRNLVATMDAARAERRAKKAEADALLVGLDGFLLATLGLTPPPNDSRKVFAATLRDIRGRADADFHSPRFRTIREGIESGKYPAKPLSDLCSRFQSGFAAGKQDQAFDYDVGVPHLRPLNMNAAGELSLRNTKFVPKSAVSPSDYCERQDVLFNNTNSAEMVGKSDVFEFDQPCACSNHMTRLRAASDVSPHYLAAVFNMLRRLGYFSLLATKFNNQAGINLDTLKPLRVPAAPPDVQETIATEARRRREEARRLRAEAEAGWQAAKRWFEEQLLGPAQP